MLDWWKYQAHVAACPLAGVLTAAVLALVLSSGPAARPAMADTDQAPVGPIDVQDRAAVARAYNTIYLPTRSVPVGWTGDAAHCLPGTVRDDFRRAMLTQMNFYRALAGLPGNVSYRTDFGDKAQAAVLIMKANDALSHEPPPTWRCWTPEGDDGAGNSNLGNLGVGFDWSHMEQWMEDPGSDNQPVLHRQGLLDPRLLTTGYGSTGQYGALWTNGDKGTRPAQPPWFAWPPTGFVPHRLVYPRWSLALPGADYTGARVSLTRNGRSVPVNIDSRGHDWDREPTLVWEPSGLPDYHKLASLAADERFEVVVSGITGAASSTLRYTLTVFDPDTGGGPTLTPTPLRATPTRTPTPPGARTPTPTPTRTRTRTPTPGRGSPTAPPLSRDPDCNCSVDGPGLATIRVVNGGRRRIQVLRLDADCERVPRITLNPQTTYAATGAVGNEWLVVDADTEVELVRLTPWSEAVDYRLTVRTVVEPPTPGYSRVIMDPPMNWQCDCSRWSLVETTVTFANNSRDPIGTYWYQQGACAKLGYSEIPAAAKVNQATYGTHTWQIGWARLMPVSGGLMDISANSDVPIEIAVEARDLATPTRTPTLRATPTGSPTPRLTPTRTATPRATATRTATPRTTAPLVGGRLANLSTRARVGQGDDVVIGGFVVSGRRTRVLVRAIGPSLANYGLQGVLADPVLTLYRGQTEIAKNDDWQVGESGQIRGTGLAPGHVREAALLTDLDPGLYTAIVRGYEGRTGIALVEAFPIGSGGTLANLSTRARVGLGDEVVIGGFIIAEQRTQVLIRALGPDLTQLGVPGALGDPVMTLHRGQTEIAKNDDWSSSPDANRIRATGLAPGHARDAALLVDLDPGAYTAIIRGYEGAQGIALFEVFDRGRPPAPPPADIAVFGALDRSWP